MTNEETMKYTKRIAFYGASVDPIHEAHIQIIEYLLTCGEYDIVYFVPCGKRADKIAQSNDQDRIMMITLALGVELFLKETRLVVSYDDIFMGRNTPTLDRIKSLEKKFTSDGNIAQVSWVIGADIIVPKKKYNGKNDIEAYWDEGELFSTWGYQSVVISRQGVKECSIASLQQLIKTKGWNTKVAPIIVPEVSSSKIRQEMKKPFPVLKHVSATVTQYMLTQRLYAECV